MFRITIARVEVHRSARKHGVGDGDIRQAGNNYLIAYRLDDDRPVRELRLGFDRTGRLLEIVVLLLDDGSKMAIHAKKVGPSILTCCHDTSGGARE